jgi:outer membrane receptor protein involved in Fe transport
MRKTRFINQLLATTICGAALVAAPAYGQEVQDVNTAEPSTGPVENTTPDVSAQGEVLEDEGDEAIVVTGSRIPQPNLTAVSPVTVINSQEVKLQGTTRTEDLLNSLPQAFASQGGNLANGATGTATVNLRGLGSARTLVLINGRRLGPGDPTFPAPDINVVPAALIERVDVLTGGASSVYGSDAVAGVVNFIMDTDFEGFRIDAQYSLYQHTNNTNNGLIEALNLRGFGYPQGSVADGGTVDVNAVFGTDFADGRGHITAYAGYRKLSAVLQADRDYSACTSQVLSDNSLICGGSATNQTGTIILGNGDLVQINGADRGITAYNAPFNFAPFNYYQRPGERYTFGAFAEYEINEAIQPYLEVMFMDDVTVAQIAPSGNFGNTGTVNCGSPENPADGTANPLLGQGQLDVICADANLVRPADDPTTPEDESDAPPIQFFDSVTGAAYVRGQATILRRNVEGGPRQDNLRHTNFRTAIGSRGELSNAWSYDAYYLFGQTNFAQTYLNEFSANRLARAIDIVTGPNGQPTCRSVLDGTDPNCVPYDVFGGSISNAAVQYLSLPGFANGEVKQSVASASFTGLLGEYGLQMPWADEGLGINFGAEYRKDSVDYRTDAAFQAGDLTGQGAPSLPVEGSVTVKELFGEARLPIVTGGFFHYLSVEAGYRYSKYSTDRGNKFTTNSYKIGLDFSPIQDIRLRASYNRAVRAPNIQELFAPQRVALLGNADPCEGDFDPLTPQEAPSRSQADCALTGLPAALYGSVPANPAAQYNGQIGGNENLQPEKSTTKSAGIVLRPRFLPGFAATVDYFDIDVKNTITVIGVDTIIETCLDTGNPEFCNRINRDAQGTLWLTPQGFVQDLNTNIGGLSTKGVDFGASYGTEIGAFGSLNFNVVATWLDELITDNGVSVPYDCAGFYGLQCGTPNPEWRHKARLSWNHPSGVGLSLQWRHFSGVKLDESSDNETLAGDFVPFNEKIKAQNYFDLAGTFRVGDNYAFRLGVNNIFDREPPIIGANGSTSNCPGVVCSGNTFPQVYDALGRYIFAGVTLDF